MAGIDVTLGSAGGVEVTVVSGSQVADVSLSPGASVHVSLSSHQGVAGPPGPPAPGAATHFTSGAPLPSVGNDGDVAVDVLNSRWYQKALGAWTLQLAVGSGGGSDAHYIHTQNVPASTWIVAHALGKRPTITVVDSAGDECDGDVHHDSTMQATIEFSAPFSGVAVCN